MADIFTRHGPARYLLDEMYFTSHVKHVWEPMNPQLQKEIDINFCDPRVVEQMPQMADGLLGLLDEGPIWVVAGMAERTYRTANYAIGGLLAAGVDPERFQPGFDKLGELKSLKEAVGVRLPSMSTKDGRRIGTPPISILPAIRPVSMVAPAAVAGVFDPEDGKIVKSVAEATDAELEALAKDESRWDAALLNYFRHVPEEARLPLLLAQRIVHAGDRGNWGKNYARHINAVRKIHPFGELLADPRQQSKKNVRLLLEIAEKLGGNVLFFGHEETVLGVGPHLGNCESMELSADLLD